MKMLIAFVAPAIIALTACASPSDSGRQIDLGKQGDDPNSISGVAAFIRTADRIVIFSISPKVFRRFGARKLTAEELTKGGYGVYGSVALENAERPVLSEKFMAVFESADRYFRCYDPRHAILARKGSSACLVEICFECEHVYWTYSGGKRTGTKYSLRSHGKDLHEYLDTRLRAGGVTLAADVNDEPKGE